MHHGRRNRSSFLLSWEAWTAGFLSFPVAGLAATAVAGRVDTPLAALTAGVVSGVVISSGQSLASWGRVAARRWIPATGIGMGVGLLLGAQAVDYGTSLTDLALMGALTGIPLGVAQTVALPSRARGRWAWAAAMPALWALGWTVTTLVGVDVDKQYAVFGAIGALAVSALSGLLLQRVLPEPTASPAGRTAERTA
jgi:hypothetical protein